VRKIDTKDKLNFSHQRNSSSNIHKRLPNMNHGNSVLLKNEWDIPIVALGYSEGILLMVCAAFGNSSRLFWSILISSRLKIPVN